MNQLLLFITVLVAFAYYGGSNVPKALKDNKQMLLGVVIGLVLPSVGVNIPNQIPPKTATMTRIIPNKLTKN